MQHKSEYRTMFLAFALLGLFWFGFRPVLTQFLVKFGPVLGQSQSNFGLDLFQFWSTFSPVWAQF